jgi:biotin--protein ligase
MNVLVYNGPGVSQTSLSHTLSSLRALLLPHFAVQTITAPALASQPWYGTCALLVIPGGRDMPYVSSLANANASIRSYVEGGGTFLGICAGAYYASRRVEWETGTKMEVTGDRPLGFFDGVCKGSVYPGFAYESESGARAVSVEDVEQGEVVHGMYHNGGGEFVGAEKLGSTEVIARYTEGEGEGKVAAVKCKVGKGLAILWGTHPEYPLMKEPLLSALKKREEPLSDEESTKSEARRWTLLRRTLILLGLHIPSPEDDANKSYTSPLPQFLTSSVPSLARRIYDMLSTHCQPVGLGGAEPKILIDSNDAFRLHKAPEAASILLESRSRPENEENLQLPKDIIFYEDGGLPEPELTPKFSIKDYYVYLSDTRSRLSAPILTGDAWGMGELFMYAEAVTSTQTMLDR